MRKVLLALLVAVLATAAVVVGVLLNRSPDEPEQEDYESVPLSAYDTAAVALVRDAFCDTVPADAVTEAVGGEPQSSASYDNGERARLDEGLRDVAHEFGCRWTTPGATARAWLFAPPVTVRSAREIARSVRQEPDCEPIADAPDFGNPSASLVCETGSRLEASYRGLFGDAWLTCSLSTEGDVPQPGWSTAPAGGAWPWSRPHNADPSLT